jgi:pimeloyl-ACP methyl ester carboxylesterase
MVPSTSIELEGGSVIVWQGGSGVAVLLIHGAWGGAPVWTRLAERFRVVAPDLPASLIRPSMVLALAGSMPAGSNGS